MFETLTEKLQSAFSKLKSKGKLSEADIDDSLKEIKLALLEADVNFKVVKNFISRIKEEALDSEALDSFTPGQQIVKIVRDELIELLGGETEELQLSSSELNVILLVGLQGSGKTTTAGKIARKLEKDGFAPYLVPADLSRPAAVDQLEVVARETQTEIFDDVQKEDPVATCSMALEEAKMSGYDVVIIDTAGRLHIDETLMEELQAIKQEVDPAELLFVADSMTGQDAVNSADTFHEKLNITGTVLTKLDGDARGGAAISISSVTGVPVKLVGTGEKYSDLELFHPDRMVSRILGMGDVLSLVEKIEDEVEEEEAQDLEKRLKEGKFTLKDFKKQLNQIKKLGPMDKILGMLPGMGQMKEMISENMDSDQLDHIEAIINSMTKEERKNHTIINYSRKRRIAKGAGRPVSEVTRLLKQFAKMKKFMKKAGKDMNKGKLKNLLGDMKGFPF